jgi:hypothetical protein
MKTTVEGKWRVTELSGEDVARAAQARAFPSESLKPFFDWQFRTAVFDFAVVASSQANLLSRIVKRTDPSHWLKVVLDAGEARASQSSLEKKARAGFELLVATTSTVDDLRTFFADYGYHSVGEATLGDSSKHDLLGSWNDTELLRALVLASRMKASAVCCFAHDADPIYLLVAARNTAAQGTEGP